MMLISWLGLQAQFSRHFLSLSNAMGLQPLYENLSHLPDSSLKNHVVQKAWHVMGPVLVSSGRSWQIHFAEAQSSSVLNGPRLEHPEYVKLSHLPLDLLKYHDSKTAWHVMVPGGGRTSSGVRSQGSCPPHFFRHASRVLNGLLPPHPPQINVSHLRVFWLKNQLGMYALHGPGTGSCLHGSSQDSSHCSSVSNGTWPLQPP